MNAFAFNNDGTLKMPTAEELAKADEEESILAYTNGTTVEGTPFYVYIAVRPSKYAEFYDACVNKQPINNIEEYGEVIASGYEANPPADVVKQMREEYGFNEKFLDEMEKEALKQQGEFVKQRDDKRINDAVAMLKEKKASENSDDNNKK
jgi:hypothetical protein